MAGLVTWPADSLPAAEAQRVEGSAIEVLGVVALVAAEFLGAEGPAPLALTMTVYRRLADRGLVCRQLAPVDGRASGPASPDASHPHYTASGPT
jgi:hypothetical protein